MGIFTWTDARIRSPKHNKYGEYRRKDLLEYGSFGKILAPDGTEYTVDHYNGYGMFGMKDAYDLVAEWNRKDLPELFQKKTEEKTFGCSLIDVAKLYASGASDEEITEYARKLADEGKIQPYLVDDWKRNIGIAIACEDEDNMSLRYPLKIVTTRDVVRYEDLYPSRSTQ